MTVRFDSPDIDTFSDGRSQLDGDVAIAMHLTDSKWTFPSVVKLGVLGVLLEDLVIDLIVMIVTS